MGRAVAAVILSAMLAVPAVASAADQVFWSQYIKSTGTIRTGTPGSPATNVATGQDGPEGIAIDAAAGKIYWAETGGPNNNNGPGVIRVANLDGSGARPLYTGEPSVTDVALDPATGKLYWTDYGNGTIRVGTTSGAPAANLYTGESNPSGLVLDVPNNRIYWGSYTDGKVHVGKLDGSGKLPPFATGEGQITGLALDPAGNRLFWAVEFAGIVRVANLDGTGKRDFYPDPDNAIGGIAIDAETNRLFYGAVSQGRVRVVGLNGSGLQNLFLGETSAWYVSVLRAPAAVSAPLVGGGTQTGQAMQCSTGGWVDDRVTTKVYRAPQSFAYQWLKDGAPIAGATASEYVPFAPGGYSCTVTAANAAGSATQTSAVHGVAAPTVAASPPPPATTPPVVPPKTFPKLQVGFGGSWTVLDRGVRFGAMSISGLAKGTKVKLSCKACHVRATLTAKGRTLRLTKLRGKLLPRRKSLTITVTKPGAIGEQLVISLRKYGHTRRDRDRVAANPFVVKQRCIPAGKTKPAKTC